MSRADAGFVTHVVLEGVKEFKAKLAGVGVNVSVDLYKRNGKALFKSKEYRMAGEAKGLSGLNDAD